MCNGAARLRSQFVRDLEEGRQSDAEARDEAKSFGPKLDATDIVA